MEQAPISETSGRKGAFPRLRNMSTATVRRLSRPLSLVSGRSISPAPERTPNKLKKTSTPNSIASRTSRAMRPPSSRRTSLLSRESSVSQDDREPLGELPVFGVSQRAYLASLVSLFSNTNGRSTVGSPQSANTPITDPSSGATSLGLYEYDIHSSAIYQYSKVRRLYVGWPGQITPPPEALLEFEMETLPLLERDLQGISGYLGQQGIRITYELRMSGYASATAETVFLSPTVWILYRASSTASTKVSVAELHQAVSDIFYLQKGLEIQEGGGRIELTSDRSLIDVELEEKESIELSDGGKLSIHIEDCQEKYSVCGALCCVTVENDGKQVQSLCRIGGLLKVNGKYILGVSTAHAMLEGSGIFRDSFNDSTESRLPPGQAVDRDEILSDSRRVSAWHSVSRDAAVDFLGISMNSRGEMAINRSKPENATDFALLRLSKMPAYVRNKYIPPFAQEPVSITSTASASAAAMDEGPVHIICGGGDVAEGQLVWGSACFIIRGRNFRVRRIQTTRPLSAGTTGAWVVRGEVMYGVIIAVYENEPFALMMTVERLFASILGSAFSIRSVELWDGEVPEALLRKVQDEAKSSNMSKSSDPAKSRRQTETETRDKRNGTSSSKHPESVNGVGSSSQHRKRSEGTQTLPKTVEGGTQTEEPCPSTDAIVDAGKSPKPTAESSSPGPSSRRRVQTRSDSVASDVSMSGAVQDDLPPQASHRKRRSDAGDSAVSAGAHTVYTTASETLERQDSGFEAAAPAVQTPVITPDNEAGDETPRRGLQAPPIRPAEASRNMNLRGGVWPDEHSAQDIDGDSNVNADRTPTRAPPQDRRSSYQNVFGKAFGRSSRQASVDADNHGIPPTGLSGRRPLFGRRRSSAIDPKSGSSRAGSSSNAPSHDDNHGIPPTGLDGKRPLFSRRRSSAIDPKSVSSRVGSSSNAPSGSNERPSSSTRTGTANSQKRERFTKENNYGIPPGGLDDRRPLSFIRRLSAQAPEPERPTSDSNHDPEVGPSTSRGSSGIGERPLSFIRRSKGKAPEEPPKFSKENNFGIPPTGL
ncbi:hypothetical protein N0V93_006330 [Gnomoniopsis smithogilvyi]|uniref:Uncharacterized protein n=1 Tax=Gnomoniopsis smithogilvyi TaxID=1191159 RepID=A0A9W8YPM6_9PEZI|nr:hypothetical protein N0V93_006330 [Gnomoniopsis smithogilvyi]